MSSIGHKSNSLPIKQLPIAKTYTDAEITALEASQRSLSEVLTSPDVSTYGDTAYDAYQQDTFEASPKRSHSSGTRIELQMVNDSMILGPLTNIASEEDLIPQSRQQPGAGRIADDDGWTHSSRLNVTHTSGNTQVVVDLEDSMLTEDGVWLKSNQEMINSKRTDVAHATINFNTRNNNDGVRTYTSIGGGIQARGDMDGYKLQRDFHEQDPSTKSDNLGRTKNLQSQQSRDGIHITPVFTGGIRQETDIAEGVTFGAEGTAFVPLGEGVGSVRAKLDARYSINGEVLGVPVGTEFSAGINIDHTFNNDETLDFNQQNFTAIGGHLRTEFDVNGLGISAEIEVGGARNEPTGKIGVSYSFGNKEKIPKAWINPSAWK